MVIQVERRPRASRNSSPLTLTSFLLPPSVIFSTRPCHWPLPSRWSTVIEVRFPSDGQAFSTAASDTSVFQVWFGLPDHPSYGSFLAPRWGWLPAASQPPLLEENCVNAGRPWKVRI